jgi:BON domain-containing protein
MSDDQPEYLVGRIQQALATDPRTGELELDIRIAGGRVFVIGTVATRERCESVLAVVRETAPDLDVQDQLSVTEEQTPGPSEPLQ